MSEPKRHHYLPKFYLDFFCSDGLLWVYDQKRKEYRQQTSKNTAVQNQYYSAFGPDGKKHIKVEQFLSVIESLAKPVMVKINDKRDISFQDKEALAIFISFLKVRVPNFEKAINEMTEKIIKKQNEFMFSSEENTAIVLKNIEEKTGKNLDVSPKDFMEFVLSGQYDMEFSREHSLETMLSLGEDLIKFFLSMDWIFLYAQDKTSFITSDNPFVLVPPDNYSPKGFYGVGLITPGARKVIPLTQRTCLVMGDYGQRVIRRIITSEDVRKVNLNIAVGCDSLLIARDKPLLEKLVKMTKINEWQIKSRVAVG